MPEAEPGAMQQLALPAERDRPDRDVARYLVRFVLRVVEPKGATFTELRVGEDEPGGWIAQCIIDV